MDIDCRPSIRVWFTLFNVFLPFLFHFIYSVSLVALRVLYGICWILAFVCSCVFYVPSLLYSVIYLLYLWAESKKKRVSNEWNDVDTSISVLLRPLFWVIWEREIIFLRHDRINYERNFFVLLPFNILNVYSIWCVFFPVSVQWFLYDFYIFENA